MKLRDWNDTGAHIVLERAAGPGEEADSGRRTVFLLESTLDLAGGDPPPVVKIAPGSPFRYEPVDPVATVVLDLRDRGAREMAEDYARKVHDDDPALAHAIFARLAASKMAFDVHQSAMLNRTLEGPPVAMT
jgi:hypothetical protein